MIKKTRKNLLKGNSAVAAAGAVALAATATVYMEKKTGRSAMRHDKQQDTSDLTGICPTCNMILSSKSTSCSYCKTPLKNCLSCGYLYNSNARYCPACGMENDSIGIIRNGTVYKGPIREPFPKEKVTYEYCCCGTPFGEQAHYCQLCGRKRPNPGTFYYRD